jgi:site-specific DNA-methyltransferase (adenine-specific)
MIDLDAIRAIATRVEVIGNAVLILADSKLVLPYIQADHIITDPPYSEMLHKHFDDSAARLGTSQLGYSGLTPEMVVELAGLFHQACTGWIAWMTDHELSWTVRKAMESHGRATFPPVPFFHKGRSARLSGDGPSSWTDYIMVSRTAALHRWGTLPGGYYAEKGWNDKARMGGKPTRLMRLMVCDYSRPGELVCDPFMGAGTTGVACANEGRRFVGIEIDPAAFETCCQRIAFAEAQGPDMFAESAA